MTMPRLSPKRPVGIVLLAGLVLPQGALGQAAKRVFRARIAPAGAVWAPGGIGVASGAVALAPEVRYVPTGSVLDATATVSHDRRYVTITAGPQMSQLLKIQNIEVDLIWGGRWGWPGPVLGARAKRPIAAPPPALDGKYAEMAHAAALVRQQRGALAEVLQARKLAEVQWDLASGVQLCQLRFRKAEAKTPAARGAIDRQIRTLQAGRDRIAADYHKRMMSLLTPQQRFKANGYLLARHLRERLAHLGLSHGQRAKVREVCDTAARTYFSDADITQDQAITAKCLDQIASKVLTEAQRQKHAKAHPAR